MNQVITSERIPIKLWLDDIEEGAKAQAVNLAKLPFAFRHIAIMPDAHQGYGMPIGGVLAARGAVVPNAVGVDIGCGMCAAQTSLRDYDAARLKTVIGLVRERVPVGFNHHDDPQPWAGFDDAPDIPIVQKELYAAKRQLGTLGGGNHFMELQRDDEGFVWLMLHSGSRNFGLKIAKHYHDLARKLCKLWYSELPDPDLAFFPVETSEAGEYMRAMDFALAFALESRQQMMREMSRALQEVFPGIEVGNSINVHHNYAQFENHFGTNVVVHRKGATSARLGEYGIIPGSQGTASYIVRGLGNPESFNSCSHGAGRRMGRKQAQRELDLADEIQRLNDAGVIHSVRSIGDLDEAAGAYKDIDTVMRNQADLVKIVARLEPLAVVKA
jgi:tRNA-splicing ligase RtcB (3'-phosphate/5'-hydroxy nucleic acid ligase)